MKRREIPAMKSFWSTARAVFSAECRRLQMTPIRPPLYHSVQITLLRLVNINWYNYTILKTPQTLLFWQPCFFFFFTESGA